MASKRCIPTTFFSDPDVVELSMPEQLILIGLVLDADDYGRGVAHASILGRKLGFGPEQIEPALETLQRFGFIQCYQVERHRYYWLCRWDEWQSLSKPTPSKYPAPPSTHSENEDTQGHNGFSLHPLGNPGKPWETHIEGEEEQNLNEKRSEGDEEGGHRAPPNVVNFPAPHTTSTTTGDALLLEQKTRQVAAILKLTVNDALTRIVAEYHTDPSLSLLGEADAAREWIEDRLRNKKGQRMSPAFFRRWLKREHEDARRRQAQPSRAAFQDTGTTGASSTTSKEGAASSSRPILPASLMHLQQHYQRQAAQAHSQTQEKPQ